MREPENHDMAMHRAPDDAEQVVYDEEAFFRSFYKASVREGPTDRNTIGAITDAEARFHYNVTENAILQVWMTLFPPARGVMIEAQRQLALRRRRRSMDVGAGTGHWCDFARDVLLHTENVLVEIVPQMVQFLEEKYASVDGVTVTSRNITSRDFSMDELGGPVELITAIGVMFHIVDDAKWKVALENLAAALRPGGLLVIGGAFGTETFNSQFHKTDQFESWREFDRAEAPEGAILVNKRCRSLGTWLDASRDVGLEVVDLVRSRRLPMAMTPENDILVLRRPAG
ncbi:MAG: methyltransferase domain-containing protein [Myxococcota bacterium]